MTLTHHHHHWTPLPDRVVVPVTLLVAVGWAIMAWGFWVRRDFEAYLPGFWPVVFAAASAATFALLVWPTSRGLLLASGALTTVSAASRVAAVVINAQEGLYAAPNVLAVGIPIYTAAAVGMALWWIRELGPWSEARARQKEGRDA